MAEPIDTAREAKTLYAILRLGDHMPNASLAVIEEHFKGILARHTRCLADEVEEGGIVDEDASLFKVANWLRQQADKLERGKGV